MEYLDRFNALVGDTLMYCQRVEHDVKIIYAAMLKGDFNQNLSLVAAETLGTVVTALKKLDKSDSRPTFSHGDFAVLKEIKNVRNWLCHRCYVDFLYLDGRAFEDKLCESFDYLFAFNRKLKCLSAAVEKVRFDMLKKYGRI